MVSVPRAIGVKHAPTATADPEDEPPLLCQAQANEQQGERAREEDLRERIAAETRQNSNSPSAIALMHDTRMVSLGNRSPSRPPEPVLAPLTPSHSELTLSTAARPNTGTSQGRQVSRGEVVERA